MHTSLPTTHPTPNTEFSTLSHNHKMTNGGCGQNYVNWPYMCLCVWALLIVCSFIGHKTTNGCDIVREAGIIFPTQPLRQILKLNTNPPLNLTLPATHRLAAVLPLLT